MKYEIKINSRWTKVSHYIWRSWTGHRRINGVKVDGPVYYLGSENISQTTNRNRRIELGIDKRI